MKNESKPFFRGPLAILLVLSLSLAGCALSQKHLTSEQIAFQEEMKEVKNGYAAFQSDDFEQAAKTFSELYESSRHDDIKRKALYGLACSKLILADSLESRNAAIDLWQQWLELLPDDMAESDDEDPRLMTPLLGRIVPGSRDITAETLNSAGMEIAKDPGDKAGQAGDPATAGQLKTAETERDEAGQPANEAEKSATATEYKSALEDKNKGRQRQEALVETQPHFTHIVKTIFTRSGRFTRWQQARCRAVTDQQIAQRTADIKTHRAVETELCINHFQSAFLHKDRTAVNIPMQQGFSVAVEAMLQATHGDS